jgi:rare lipoprotein A
MRRPIAHGLAVFLCVASLGAAQGDSGSVQNRSGPVRPQPKAATKSAKKPKPYQVGTASWYGSYFQGKDTASGEAYNMYDFTAAHPTLPLGTYVRVTNLRNGRAVVVRVNDRGPVVDGRIIDMSYGAAQALGMKSRGLQQVRLDLVETPPTVAELRPVAHLN